MSRIFVFTMYFCPPTYFLTEEDISLKLLVNDEKYVSVRRSGSFEFLFLK